MLTVGASIPDFEIFDSEGNCICNEDLLGSLVVLYFYPKDETPGCTQEACDFRDAATLLDEQGVILLGASPDNADSHQRFCQKHSLNFSLLVDEDKTLCTLFGVLKEKDKEGKKVFGVERTTFVIDEKGIIRWIERPVSVDGHVDRVLKAVQALL